MDSIKMEQIQKQFEQLFHTVEELGGTIYEVARDSGFRSAYEYMLKWTDSEDETENITSDDVTLLTECYVYEQDFDEAERIFLFSKDEEETFLRSLGTQKDGRFLVPVHALKELERAGYLCLNDRTPLTAWTSDYTFMGDGWNRALYVETPMEDVYLMPDIYAVQQAVKIYHAECLIRKNRNPRFFAERINEADETLLSNIETLLPTVFPEHWLVGYKEKTMPLSYQKLVYQICYIKYYYEDIYQLVWLESFYAASGEIFVSEDETLRKGIHAVAEAFDAKEEYCLKEEERALVLCLNDTDFDVGFVEKCDGNLICLTDTCKIDLKECMEDADKRLIEKMKETIDFEWLNIAGIREEDEKYKDAFEEFYGTLERVKRQFLRNDEATIIFKNLWMGIYAPMKREEYRECMLPVYQVITKNVQEMCSVDRFSKIYLVGDKSDDISFWEYLEEQYQAEVCILMK